MTGGEHHDNTMLHISKTRRLLGRSFETFGSPIRAIGGLILTLVLALLITDVVQILPSSDPDGSVLAASGCIGMVVEDVEREPAVPLEEAEIAVREEISERGLTAEYGSGAGEPFEPGDVHWAEYGPLREPGRPLGIDPAEAPGYWVFIFEDERDDPLYSRFWRRPTDPRFTAFYDPEQDRITQYCGGYASND